jgi:hypothetical protein
MDSSVLVAKVYAFRLRRSESAAVVYPASHVEFFHSGPIWNSRAGKPLTATGLVGSAALSALPRRRTDRSDKESVTLRAVSVCDIVLLMAWLLLAQRGDRYRGHGWVSALVFGDSRVLVREESIHLLTHV